MIKLPANEKRKFHHGVLPNNLKYTIIQDTSDIMNVSFSVKVGSLMDKFEYMGMAHFLEHMLFLGSKKYPDESYFQNKLNSNGGECNAYTSLFETVYFFNTINNREDILDIFSRFFIDPLFNMDSVEREINAINSEHMKNINNDTWITRQIIYNLAKKDSMINRFTTGNFDTLKNHSMKKLRDEMILFYNNYYCSDNMCLTIVSNEDTSVVERYIKKYFSSIPSKVSFNIDIIKKGYYKNKYEIVMIPTNMKSNIIYFWEVNTFDKYLLNKAIYVISYLIEYNGEDNLKNILKKKGLATNISCNYMEEGIFILNIQMTEMNDNNIQSQITSINNIVSFYIDNFLQEQIDWKTFYNYYKDTCNINYMYGGKIDNNELATIISVNMMYYKPEYIYCGNMIVINEDLNKLKETVRMLKFDKCNIIYSTKKKIKTYKLQTDNYYNTKYGYIYNSLKYDSNKLIKEHFEIDLSAYHNIINFFNNNKPRVIMNLNKYIKPIMLNENIWYGACDKFNEMNVFGFYFIGRKSWVSNAYQYIVTSVALSLLNQYISIKYNMMTELGCSASFSVCNITGYVTFTISGYNNMYNDFFKNIKKTIGDITLDPVIVNITIDNIKQNIIGMDKLSPWNYSTYILDLLQFRYSYKNEDKLKGIDLLKNDKNDNNHININIIKKRIKSITRIFDTSSKKVSITSLTYGNINKENINMITSEKTNYHINKPKYPTDKIIIHPNRSDMNYVILKMLPCGKFKPSRMAKIIILNMIMEQPCFNMLRTTEQLGYMVNCSIYYNSYNYYIMIKVQSVLDKIMVDKKMNNFILYMKEYLVKLDKNTFNNIKKSAYKMLLQEPNTMIELIDRYIDEIKYKKYIFDRNILISKYINNIKIDEIIYLYSDIIKNIITIKII